MLLATIALVLAASPLQAEQPGLKQLSVAAGATALPALPSPAGAPAVQEGKSLTRWLTSICYCPNRWERDGVRGEQCNSDAAAINVVSNDKVILSASCAVEQDDACKKFRTKESLLCVMQKTSVTVLLP